MTAHTTLLHKSNTLLLAKAFAFLFLFNGQLLFAQDVELEWAYSIGSAALTQDRAGNIYTDAMGNVYATGSFLGPVDFDPGADTTTVTSSFFDAYISKMDASGNLVWAKSFGGSNSDVGKAIYVDPSENVYVTGNFYGSGDFDPGAGTTTLSSNGYLDMFIIKFNAVGDFQWAHSFGGTLFDYGTGVQSDANGNVYVTGEFSGTVDFDPGAGTYNLTASSSKNMFILKLDASGNFIWVKNMTGTGSSGASSLSLDANGNIYTTGSFSSTVDFDPGTGTTNLTSNGGNDIFISKLDADGNFIWAKNMGGSSTDQAKSLSLDGQANVYITGKFSGMMDFDPGAGTQNMSSNGVEDIFVVKLNSSGNYVWAKTVGGTGVDEGNAINVDHDGNAYLTGSFTDTVDFNPGIGIHELTSEGSYDVFIAKLNYNGNFVWAKQVGGSSYDVGISVDVDVFGNIYATGDFQDTVDFDPGLNENIISVNSPDVFIMKLRCAPSSSIETAIECESYLFNGVTYTNSNNTATDTLTNSAGCDSIIYLDLTIVEIDTTTSQNGDTLTSNEVGASYQWINCVDHSLITGANDSFYVATVSGDYAVVVTVGSCSDTSVCATVNIINVGVLNRNGSDMELVLYPNPSHDKITISNYTADIENISILSVTGQIIESFKPLSDEINISHLDKGLYLIQIQIEDTFITQKLVKN